MCGGGHLFTKLRDAVESVGSLAGNYFLPGSSLVTDKLVSKGSQKQLGSTVGQLAQLGTGFAGSGVGSSFTGIPSASEVGGGWTNAGNAVGGAFGDATLGTDVSNGISSATKSLLSSLGLGDAASTAETAAPTTGVGTSAIADIPGSTVSRVADATGGAAGTTSAPSSGIMGTIKNALSGATGGDLLKYGLPAAGVANSVLSNRQNAEGLKELKSAAAGSLNAGNELVNSLATGKLPPGAQSTIDQGVNDAITAIKSHYASMGMSGSSAETQDIERARQSGVEQAFTYANQATQTGLQALGQGSTIYDNIMKTILGQNQGLSSSLAALAGAGGGGGNTTSKNGLNITVNGQ